MNIIKKPIDFALDNALKFYNDGNLSEEVDCYKKILSSYSNNYILLIKLLNFQFTIERWEVAIETISSLKKITSSSDLIVKEAFVNAKLKNFTLAIELLKTVLKSGDANPVLYNNIVKYYNSALLIDEGIEYFNDELKEDQGNPDFYYSLSFLHYYKAVNLNSKDFTSVLEYSRLGEKYRPNDTHNLNVLGLVYFSSKTLDKAEYYFLESIKADPSNAMPHSNLGFIYAYDIYSNTLVANKDDNVSSDPFPSEIKKALYHLNTALKLEPSLTESLTLLGDILYSNKMYDEAIKIYKKTSTPRALEGLVKSYYCSKDYDNFHLSLKNLSKISNFRESREISALLSHATINLDLDIINFYCPNPLDYIHYIDLPSPDNSVDFNEKIINECNSLELGIRKQGLLSNGQQSNITLFDQDSIFLLKLKNSILKEVTDYKKRYKDRDIEFITNWPKTFHISAWIVSMDKGGSLSPHNHPNGWLSGVYYLSVPDKINKHEGNINFSLVHPDYPKSDVNFPNFELETKNSRLVLFPSSLYHSTVPFSDIGKRICIAFDFQPVY